MCELEILRVLLISFRVSQWLDQLLELTTCLQILTVWLLANEASFVISHLAIYQFTVLPLTSGRSRNRNPPLNQKLIGAGSFQHDQHLIGSRFVFEQK